MNSGPREQRFEVNGLNINTVQWGRSNQAAVVLLHGLRSNARTWDRLAEQLQDRYHVIAIDQRGRGSSDWDSRRRYYTQNYVEDLKQIVDALHLEQFVLLGHSMGGANALIFSEQYPQRLRALIIEDMGPDAGVHSGGRQRTARELANMPLTFESRVAAHQWLASIRSGLGDSAIRQRVDAMLEEDSDGRMRWRFDLEGIAEARLHPLPGQNVDLWPALSNSTLPILVLRGENSDYLDDALVERMQACNSRVNVQTIARASHFVHDDNFDDYWRSLDRFLRSLEAVV